MARFTINKRTPDQQQGAALLLFILLLIVGSSTLLVSKLNKAATQSYRDDVTMKALVKAKEALIGYAVSYPDNPTTTNINAGPGYLPCPDVSVPPNGSPSPCSPNTVGRLPWEFIGLDEIRDSSGEHLWYVISDDFRNNPTKHFPLNSETSATLSVDAATDIVAILFAPGNSFTGQARPSSDAKDYLEGENSNGDSVFVSSLPTGTDFNDQVLTITRQELMAAVEKRVMGEVSQVLTHYRATFGGGNSYPWLSPFKNPRTSSEPITEKDQSVIRGTITADSNTSLIDTTKNFGQFDVKSGDIFFNSTQNIMGFVTTDAADGNSALDIAPVSPTSSFIMQIGDNYVISRYNGQILTGKTTNQGLLPIHYDNEAFRTAYEIDWSSFIGNTESICSQIDFPTLHISILEGLLKTSLSPLSMSAENNLCVWNNERTVNCIGVIESPITFISSGTPETSSPEPCDTSNPILSPSSNIQTRRYTFRLNFIADTTAVVEEDGSKIRNIDTNTFTLANTGGPETEIVIQDLSASGEVLGEARLITPQTGSNLTVSKLHMNLAPLSGLATSGGTNTLKDTNKNFKTRGVLVGHWVENIKDNSRARVTNVNKDTLTLTTLSGGSSFITNDAYRIYSELPKWFTYNNWHHLNYIAFSSDNEPGNTSTCTSSNCLILEDSSGTFAPNNDNKQAIVVAAGQALTSLPQNRTGNVTISDYFEAENTNGDRTFDLGSFDPTLDSFNDQIKRIAPCSTNSIDNCY